jgi:hypothetical protein
MAWAQGNFDFTTVEPDVIAEHPAHGFGGYAFGSSKEYVRAERARKGNVITEEYAGWLWYEGEIDGCGVNSGYEFERGRLVAGLWTITNNQFCFGTIQDLLSRTYGSDLEMEIDGSTVKVEMWIPHTRIVHRKNDRFHGVNFYDTIDRTRIGGN